MPHLSANSDEGIYLLQADTLLDGDLAPAAPDAEADAFLPWFAVIEDGRYVLKYTPVHAAVLAAGGLLPGPERIALAGIAAAQVLAVAALASQLGVSHRAGVAAVALFALSPLVLHLDLTYLPYGTSLSLSLGAMAALLRAARLRSFRWAALGGLAWGLAFFARPYDAVLFLVIIGVSVAWTAGRAGLVAATAGGAAGALLPLAAFLAFNAAVTGDALQLPFNLAEPSDTLGFGERRALPGDAYITFGPGEAVASLGRNLLLVVAWTGGGVAAVAVGGWALVRGSLPRLPILAALVVWPIGYGLFWGSYLTAFVWDGALFLGPYYYLPMVPMVSIAAGVGLTELGRFGPKVPGAAMGVMAVLSLLVLVPALADQLDRSSQRIELADALDDAVQHPALVLVPPVYGPYLQNPFSFLRNEPDLDGPVVYALARGPRADARLVEMYPDRNAYRLELPRGWSDQTGFVPVIEIELLAASEHS